VSPLPLDSPSVIAVSNAELVFPAFDRKFYAATNPGLDPVLDPLRLFVNEGWKHGNDANANFSCSWYLYAHPDVKGAGLNPLVHFLRFGKAEGRAYRASMFRVVLDRDRERVAPHFDRAFYLSRRGDKLAHADPLDDFLLVGWRIGLDPSPAFSCSRYLRDHPKIRSAGINPLMHALGFGEVDRVSS
jgi:hypothetical protein